MGIIVPITPQLLVKDAECALLKVTQSILQLDTRLTRIRAESPQPLVWAECAQVTQHLEDIGLAVGIIEQGLQEVRALTRLIERHHAG